MGLFGGKKARFDKDIALVNRMLAQLLYMSFHESSEFSKLLRFKRSDSRFRYELFCLGLVIFSCGRRLSELEAVASNFVRWVTEGALREPQVYLGDNVDSEFASEQGIKYFNYYLERLTDMGLAMGETGTIEPGVDAMCRILHEIESPEPISSTDSTRLSEMSGMFFGAMEAMRSAGQD